jgi:GAF domain-containing protein
MLTPIRQFYADLSFTVRYTLLGALFGLAFPIMATGILLWTEAMPISLASIIELHRTEPLLWIIDTAPFFLGLFASFAGRREDHLRDAYAHLQQDERQLQQLTQQLQWRSTQLMISSEISSRLATILNLEELLAEIVNQIKENFGYYHAHIYLLDDKGEKLVVVEGTGRAGAELKARGHHIDLDAPTSLVARAARSGEIVRIDNVRETDDWLPNPLLPDTCSEIVVPIILKGQVVGVLDVQEDEVAGLDESDANLLRSLANQVAVAIRNARLFAQVENALAEARAAQERYSELSWERTRVGLGGGQHLYVNPNIPPPDKREWDVMTEVEQKALAQKHSVVVANENLEGESLVAPISLHDRTIGTLQLTTAGKGLIWDKDDVSLVEAVVDQLAQTAENLRLFEETRQRAGREQTIREITDKLRAVPNLDALLETAARELGQRLGVRHTVLELGIEKVSDGEDTSTGGKE